MGCLNGKKLKFLLLFRSKQQTGQKKYPYHPKKVRLETRGFHATFLLLTTPYGMFEWKKKLKFLLLIRSKQQIGQKKYSQKPKKVRLETRGFRATFLLLTTPYGMFEWRRTQILIAHQKQSIDRTKKGRLGAKKSSGRDQRISCNIFAVDHPLCDV